MKRQLMLQQSRKALRLLLWMTPFVWVACESTAPLDQDAQVADAAAPEAGPAAYPSAQKAVMPLDGQLLFPVHLDGRSEVHYLVVDTGAFATTIDETLVRELTNGVGKVSIDFGGGLVLKDHSVFGGDLSKAEDYIGVPIHGLIGQDIFQTHFFTLDYKNKSVAASKEIPSSPPSGFKESDLVSVPYSLVQLLPIVEVDIGGKKARLIADTGSGVTLLTKSFVTPDLLASGVTGYFWHTSYGSDPATVLRIPSLKVGTHDVENTWAAVVPDDYHLKTVLEALGVEVDGFLGYPVYRRFYIEVRGEESRYAFYPYADTSHIDANEWDRVGIEIHKEGTAAVVDMIFEPSDAKDKGLLINDALVTIDGEALDTLSLDDIRQRLRGTPDEVKTLTIRRAEATLTIKVAIDHLL
jgi:hypothetical protein